MCVECAKQVVKVLAEMDAGGEFDGLEGDEREIQRQLMGMRLRENMTCSTPMPAPKQIANYVADRFADCAHCGITGKIQVTFEYTEGGKIKAANVTKMSDGWEYRPFGNVGGSAPYCPECLADMV